MRQRFETAEDRQRQDAIARALKRTYHWVLRSLDASNAHYSLDYFATSTSGIGQAWVEVKERRHVFGTYVSVILSAGKWREGTEFSRASGLPFLLFFQFTDGLYRYEFRPQHIQEAVRFDWGGRTSDARDEADAEPVVHIPLALWTKVDVPPEEAPAQHDF